jgi:hypothetical protein
VYGLRSRQLAYALYPRRDGGADIGKRSNQLWGGGHAGTILQGQCEL